MIDIQFIRENRQIVETAAKNKNVDIDVGRLLELDEQWRKLLQEAEELRRQRNELADSAKNQKPDAGAIERGKQLKTQLAELDGKLADVESQLKPLLLKVPNIPTDDTPVGASEDENVVTKTWGEAPKFDFEPKNHWEIAEANGWIDKERAAKIAGSRFAYIKGPMVKLQFAIVQWVLDCLTDETVLQKIIAENDLKLSAKPFMPVIPPMMIKTEVFDAMGRLEPRDQRYQVGDEQDDLWLNGSAEHTIGSMYYKETLSADDLPMRYIGYATSFRREAGTYGKDMEGILRMHQFDKLEMESFTLPEDSYQEHLLMVAIQEYLMQQLKIHYHVLLKCTADIGDPNARGVDIEAWLPGQSKFRETHSADYMTDFQSRRLQSRYRTRDGQGGLVHTNDATAFALSRTPVAIIENYQMADGRVRIPEVLKNYMGGKDYL